MELESYGGLLKMVVPSGVEPELWVSKTRVQPLHHGTKLGVLYHKTRHRAGTGIAASAVGANQAPFRGKFAAETVDENA